ncbi:MAG: hypothetical protein UY65_C0035G0007 [Parcubacteria group bacterium GW2011_GWA2_51_12]|nr:MAG: hypothetical protein UY65_C0035G0007 [Parcubacteria group bacterium GW2011_GWA2_51_12]
MRPFPYFQILHQAWKQTLKHPWLWVFGFFAGGTAGVNFGGINYIFSPPTQKQLEQASSQWTQVASWVQFHPLWFAVIVSAVFVISMATVMLAGISRGSLVWAAGKFADERELKIAEVNFSLTLEQGRKHFWRIIGLQVCTTLIFLVVFTLYFAPVVYLFQSGAISRAAFLSVFGLLFFIPAGVVLSFLHLYGPIFLVLYGLRILPALQHAFHLLRQKLLESLIFALLMLATSLMFIVVLLLSLGILGSPFMLVGYILLRSGLFQAALVWALGSGILLICYTIVLGAAFSAFQNLAWVFAVRYLVRSVNLEKEERAYAAEPA